MTVFLRLLLLKGGRRKFRFQNRIHFHKAKEALYKILIKPPLEAVVQRCSVKKLFLEIFKIQKKTPVPGTLF